MHSKRTFALENPKRAAEPVVLEIFCCGLHVLDGKVDRLFADMNLLDLTC